MINRKHRFHGPGSLTAVYRGGVTVRGPLFSVRSLLNPRRRDWRLAVVVSRKTHKSAVGRNRMRRRLYSAARAFEQDIVEPHDIILTVYSDNLLSEPAANLSAQLKRQLAQAGIFGSRAKR